MSEFWKHYERSKPKVAAAVDDVRHKLVKEAWYGRKTTGDIAPSPTKQADPLMRVSNVDNSQTTTTIHDNSINNSTSTHTTNHWGVSEPATAGAPSHQHHALYDSIWGKEPQRGDLYGGAPGNTPSHGIADPELKAPKIEPPQQDAGLDQAH